MRSKYLITNNIGYVYAISNKDMPGILKIGYTLKTPSERLKVANISNTWKPPSLYEIAIAKRVLNPEIKERKIHQILSKYTERINHRREFFRVSLVEVKCLFDIMDGDDWAHIKELGAK